MPDGGARALPRAPSSAASEQQAEWEQRFDAYREAHPELAAEFERLVRGELPPGWDDDTPRFDASGTMTATRKASRDVIQWAAAQVPELVGRLGRPGAVDAHADRRTPATSSDGSYGGRNLHFGIREHAMGAIVNGLTLHYLRASARRS